MLRIILISILICLSYITIPTSAANKYYDGESRPYEFGFKIENNQHRHEKRTENGLIMGEFGFVTADGIYHATVYATDEKGSFQIVSMQNLKVEEIVDLFNIPPPAPTQKFEIVPLKAATPPRYNSVEINTKLNAPLIPSKPVVDIKTCSTCKVPTTKRPIPITLAPVQHKTQKPFGIGLPEKLTTYRHYDVTPKQVVPSINHVDIPVRSQPGSKDDYLQVRAPEDQTLPIGKSSITPTQSTSATRPLQNHQPELRQNIPPVTGQLISIVKDSIQKVSLQQTNIAPHSPEMAQVLQKAGATKPSIREPIHKQSQSLQNIPTASPGPELLQTIQPSLLDNGPVEQSHLHIKPPTESKFIGAIRELNQNQQPIVQIQVSTQSQTNKPDQKVGAVRDSLQNVEGHPPQNMPIEQLEVSPDPSPPRLSQPKLIPDRGSKQFSLPKIRENTPVEITPKDTKLTTPSQNQFERPTAPIIESVRKILPQTLAERPIERSTVFRGTSAPIQTQFGDPVRSVNGNIQSSQPQSPPHTAINNPTVPKIPPRGSTQYQSNGPVSPVKKSLPLSQPPLPQNVVGQSVEIGDGPTLAQTQNLPDREKESVQNLQPHISTNIPTEQPGVHIKQSAPVQIQFETTVSPISGSLQNVQPLPPQNVPIEQPAFNKRPGQIQTKFINPVNSVNVDLPDPQSQLTTKALNDQPTLREPVPLESPAKQVSGFNGPSPKIQNLSGPDTTTPQPHNEVGTSTVSNISSRLAHVQSDGSPTPIRESLPLSQPPLPQNGADQSIEYRQPQKPTLNQSQNPADREREYVQNVLPHISPNIPAEQPGAHIKQSAPVQIQFETPASPISGSLQNIQPSAFNRPSGPIQTKFINPVSSVNADLPDPHSQLPPLAVTDQPTVRKPVSLESPAEQAFNGLSVKTQNLRGPGTSTPQPQNEVGSSTVSNIPSRLTQVQSDGSPTPIREALPLSQPPLSQNGVDQSVEYRDPQKPTLNQSQNPSDREREYVQNLLPHISSNITAEQPGVHIKQSTPVQIQFERPASPISGTLQNVQLQSQQNAPFEQPSALKKPSGPIQTKFINPVSSVNADFPDPQSKLPPLAVTDQPTVRKPVPLETPAEQAFNGLSVNTQDLRGPGTSTLQPHNEVGSSIISNIPSRLAQVNSDDSPNLLRESLPISQAPLPQNGPANQSLVNQELSKPTLTLSSNLLDRERDSVQNIKPQVTQNIVAERPAIHKIATTPSQDQSSEPVRPLQGPVQNSQPYHVPVQQLPVLGNQIVPNKYETNNSANMNPKPASPLDTHTQLNVPMTSKNDETLPDIHSPIKTGVLVVEPLSTAPEIRINLPKKLLNSVPRQIDSVNLKQAVSPPLQTGRLLNELKEIMLNHKIKPAQLGGAVPLERTGNFNNEFNVAQPLGSLLYRFNYTAGYHGHNEQGDQGGNKEGGYYLISRDGYRRTVDYTANEDGYRPRIHIELAQSQDVPQPDTEKEKGLGGYEFKWFYV